MSSNGLSPWLLKLSPTAACLLLMLTVVLIYFPLVTFHGVEVHNLITASTHHLTSLSDSFSRQYNYKAPSYRPMALIFYIIEGKTFDCDFSKYYITSWFLLWLLSCLTFMISRQNQKSVFVALLTALLLLTDMRMRQFQWLTGAHNLWACITGYGALHMLRWSKWPKLGPAGPVFLFALLLASPLFKEYGLAFSAGVFLAAWFWRPQRWQGVMTTSVLAVAAYFLIRWGLGHGATEGFDTVYGPKAVGGFFLNIITTFINTINGSIVRYDRVFNWWGYYDPVDFLMLALATVGFVKKPKAMLPFFGIIVANSVLNFFAYRDRNQVVGMVSFLVVFSMGLSACIDMLRKRRIAGQVLSITLIFALGTGLWLDGRWLHNFFAVVVARPASKNVSEAAVMRPDVSPITLQCALQRYRRGRGG